MASSSLHQHGSTLIMEQAGSGLEEGIHGEMVTANQASSLHQYVSNLIAGFYRLTLNFFGEVIIILFLCYPDLLMMLMHGLEEGWNYGAIFPAVVYIAFLVMLYKTARVSKISGEAFTDHGGVTSVGENTRQTEMINSTGSCNINHQFQLLSNVDRLNSNLKKVAMAFSCFIFVVLMVYYYFKGSSTEDAGNNDDHVPKGKKATMAELLREAERIIKKQGGAASRFISFSSVVLVSIRSGLLTGVLVSLPCSKKKMDHAEACATTGCIDTISTSKTIDLSLNNKKKAELWRFSFNNIQKFVQFHLTITLAGHIINFIAAITTGKIFLSQFQIWWVSLIGDPFGAFALSTDLPASAPSASPPSVGASSLTTKTMWRNIVFQALYQATMTQALHFIAIAIIHVDELEVSAMIFNSYTLCLVFVLLNAREIEKKNVFENMHKNLWFLVVVAFMVVLQVMFTCFNLELSLDLLKWCICIGIAALSLPIGWVVKFVPVPASSWV